MRITVVVAALTLSLGSLAMSAEVSAAMSRKPTNISAQELSSALRTLAKDRNFQVVYATKDVSSLRTQGAVGNYTAEEALTKLLSGTGLSYRYLDAQTVTITPGSAVAPESTTEGNQAADQTDANAEGKAERSFWDRFRVAQVDPGKTANDGSVEQDETDAARQGERQQPGRLEEVLVTGIRASLEDASRKKRESEQIQESITAEDIGKMPDNNVAETLQRLTGVQVNRDLGEGQYVAIRGLTQVQSELNGRPIFSADGNGRTLNYENLPSELLAGADVYKSPMADQIDGGIGGLIDFRTRRPFDFEGFELAGSARTAYADQARKAGFAGSLLLSDRWAPDFGDVGALLSVSYSRRNFQRDFNKNADFKAHTLLNASGTNEFPNSQCAIPGSAPGTVCMSEADYEQPDIGYRDRLGISGTLQWRPNDQTELTLDATTADFTSIEKVLGSFPCPVCASSIVASNVNFLPGTSDVGSATYANVPIINDNYYGKGRNRDRQVGLAGKWTGNRLVLDAEVTYARTSHDAYFLLVEQQAVAPLMNYDVTTQPSTFDFPGLNLADPATWHYAAAYYSPSVTRGNETAGKWDAQYKVNNWLRSIKVGMRVSNSDHSSDSVSSYNGLSGPALGANDIPLAVSSHTNLFSSIPSGWIGPDLAALEDPQRIFQTFGLTLPAGFDPHNHFVINEKTLAGYVMLNFAGVLGIPYSGNLGARYVKTRDADDGWLNQGGVFSAYHTRETYNDVLPSLNVKFELTERLLLRLAASKVLTRPDFPSLNPTLQLDNFFHTASGGNPNLRPLKADQLDSSLEWYFNSSSYVYGAAFYKHVKNFIFTSQEYETVNGTQYLTSHPSNGADGRIKGLEAGYQQFFSFLPAPLDGLGLIANFTYVDSQTPSPVQGIDSPLPQLSKTSYNLIGIYERGPASVRLAYNWRNHYIETLGTNASGIQPEVRKAYGILDFSGSYKLTDSWLVTLEGQNLTKPLRATYYSVVQHPGETQTEDRTYALGVRFSY